MKSLFSPSQMQEDVYSLNPLPGFHQVEKLSLLSADITEEEGRLALTAEVMKKVFEAWGELKDHDKCPQKFHTVYKTHCGNTLNGRTKHDSLTEAAITPAQPIDAKKNRLVYCTVKQLWLRCSNQSSPDKIRITKMYERMQQRVMVDDPVLSKLSIPLPRINSKSVRDFTR